MTQLRSEAARQRQRAGLPPLRRPKPMALLAVTLTVLLTALLLTSMSGLTQAGERPADTPWTPLAAIDATPTRVDLTSHVRIVHDPSGTASINTIAARLERFRPATDDDLKTGFVDGALWLQMVLANPGRETLTRWLVIDNAMIEMATLHMQGSAPQHSGFLFAIREKALPTAMPAFTVELKPGEQRTLLLRVESRLPLEIEPVLWSRLAWLQHSGRTQTLWAMTLGGVMMTGVLALLVFAIYRDAPYLYFALFLICGGLVQASRNGLLQGYLWPEHLPFRIAIIGVLSTSTLIALVRFVVKFLGLPTRLRNWPMHQRAFVYLVLSALAPHLLQTVNAARFATLAAFLLFVYILLVTVHVWRQGFRPARFLMIALSVAWVAAAWRQLANLGLVPWLDPLNQGYAQWLLFASPLILVALTERTRNLTLELAASRRLSETKSAFLARVSHELRSPLNLIVGYARMLTRGSTRLDPAEGAAAIEKSGLHVLALVDELLDQARLEAGHLELQPRPLALAEWLRDYTRDAQLQANAAGNTFRLEWRGADDLVVLLDGQRLRQILDNLVTNANRHTYRGQITLRCAARVTPPNPFGLPLASRDPAHQSAAGLSGRPMLALEFAVTDTGRGIARQDHERILQPFVQVDDHPALGGVGLGLSITRDLLELMGSKLTLDSLPGHGSTFGFTLTCAAGDPQQSMQNEAGPGRSADAYDKPAVPPRRATLLVAEDDPEARFLLAQALHDLGYGVLEADSGKTANALLDVDVPQGTPPARSSHIVAVLADQMMAPGDGWSVLRHVRATRPDLPVLLISAATPMPPSDWPAALQFDAVLRKPVDSATLAMTLTRLLGHGHVQGTDTTGTTSTTSTTCTAIPAPAVPLAGIANLSHAADDLHTSAPAAVQALPDAATLRTLITLVDQGAISDLEDWLAECRANDPGRARFADGMASDLRRLDLQALQDRLADALARVDHAAAPGHTPTP